MMKPPPAILFLMKIYLQTKNNGLRPTIYHKIKPMNDLNNFIEELVLEIESIKKQAVYNDPIGNNYARKIANEIVPEICDRILEKINELKENYGYMNEKINNVKSLNELDALQNEINEMFDTRRRVLNLVSEAKEMGGKSFGYLKESFENMSPKLFKSDEGKVVMNKYAKTIKENKSLSSLHKLYENIRKAHGGIDVDYFVGTICETNWNVKEKELTEGIQKLANIVAEGYIVVGEGAGKYLGTENDRLDGAIEFIAENKVGQKNIVKYSEAVKVIREAVEKNGNIADSFKKETDLDQTIEDLVSKYSKDDYSEEEEKDALQNQIARSGDEETVFVNKKTDCLKSLDEAIKKYEDGQHEDELTTLKKIHEQVSAKSYNPETIGPDICNFVEMSKLFE